MHTYAGRQFVCGILGSAPELAQRLVDLSPPVKNVVAPRLNGSLWMTRGGRWDGEPTFDLFDGRGEAADWHEVANRDRAGLAVTDHTTRLFAGATGLGTLYVRDMGDALAFSSEPDPLIELGDVTTDWDAWIDILTLGYPQGPATPVEQVMRLEPATALVAGPDGWHLERYKPYWQNAEPSGASPAEVLDRLHEAIPAVTEPTALTLSGGWDSRLLAGVLRHHSPAKLDTWTIATDDGFEQDLDLVGPVATALGANHRVRQQPDDLGQIEASYRERVFYETWFHTWLEPLAAELRADRWAIFDGLGGDVLFKNLLVSSECAHEPDPARQFDLVWDALIASAAISNPNLWSPGFASVATTARRRFDQHTRHLTGHPAAPTLAVLESRTFRGIAASPMWLFGPECTVMTPFTQRGLVEAALAIPLPEKDKGTFYRALLQAAAPDIAGLPSTNDTPKPPPRDRKSLSPHNLVAYSALIAESRDASGILPRVLADLITDPHALAADPRRSAWVRALKGASLLSAWQRRWRHRLRDIGEAPW